MSERKPLVHDLLGLAQASLRVVPQPNLQGMTYHFPLQLNSLSAQQLNSLTAYPYPFAGGGNSATNLNDMVSSSSW